MNQVLDPHILDGKNYFLCKATLYDRFKNKGVILVRGQIAALSMGLDKA